MNLLYLVHGEYAEIRRHRGIAWYPIFEDDGLKWIRNTNYHLSELVRKTPREYHDLGIEKGKSIYKIFEDAPDTFLYVPNPSVKKEVWISFEP